ncbi:MAG: M56 family metallopeptidase [Bacteroidota bacterium]
MVNWFNPFAWFIRHAIRQNLEFIADNEVVANGINKKEYQYLLLKTLGIPQYSIANNFNFSSLKKRIAMMNKMKSAKLHLTKFLFILPLMLVSLLAFRNKINDNNQESFVFTGIVYDAATTQPLEGVLVDDTCSGLSVRTDAHGFFKMHIPVSPQAVLRIVYHLELEGLGVTDNRRMDVGNAAEGSQANMLFAAIHQPGKTANRVFFDAHHQAR